MDMLAKMAPFLIRSRTVIPGRERLVQLRNRLAFILITTDISENSRREIQAKFHCPIVQVCTAEEIRQLFGYGNCKILGFRRTSPATSVFKALREFLITAS